jgi:hypothetical protein
MRHLAALLVAVALPVVAVRTLEPFVSEKQAHQNALHWAAFPEGEKDLYRTRWSEFKARPEDERATLFRRAATLDRLKRRFTAAGMSSQPIGLTPANLRLASQGMAKAMDVKLDDGLAIVSQAVKEKTRLRISAFLENLEQAERLEGALRAELEALPWDEYVRRALEIQKIEEIYMFSEIAESGDHEELDELPPLDVVELVKELREFRGFLGRAGEVIGLTAKERRLLEAAEDDEVIKRAMRILAPKVSEYMLSDLELPPLEVARVLKLPYKMLERELNRYIEQHRK